MLFNYTFIYIYAQYTILVVFAGHLNDTYCAGVIFGCVPPDGGRFLIASRHYISEVGGETTGKSFRFVRAMRSCVCP